MDGPLLPQEMLDEVIDFLHDDRGTLLQCSLASSRLLRSCRQHLFGDVVLNAFELETFLGLLDNPYCSFASEELNEPSALRNIVLLGRRKPRKTRARIPRVAAKTDASTACLGLLGSRKSSVAGKAYHVGSNPVSDPLSPNHSSSTLSSPDSSPTMAHAPFNATQSSETPAMLAALAKLDRVRSITFSDFRFGAATPLFWTVLDCMTGVKLIDVQRCSESWRFFSWIGRLPQLKSLSISNPVACSTSNQASDHLQTMAQELEPTFTVRLLDLSRSPQANSLLALNTTSFSIPKALCRWLTMHSPLPLVESLKIDLQSHSPDDATLFNTLGQGVKNLAIVLPSNPPTGGLYVDLTPFTDLESLHIEGLNIYYEHGESRPQAVIKNMLDQLFVGLPDAPVRNPGLKKVTVSVSADNKSSSIASFYGIPDYVVLHPSNFGWCKLPCMLFESLFHQGSSFTRDDGKFDVEVVIKAGSTGKQPAYRDLVESCLRDGAWMRWKARKCLRVSFPSSNY